MFRKIDESISVAPQITVDQVAEAERMLVLQKLELELQVKEITAGLVFNQEELVVAEVHLK